MHILYTILKARASSFTHISHEQLKISQKTKICSTFEFLTSTKFLAGGVRALHPDSKPESSSIQTLTTRCYNGF
jgi:hypothetical protein